MKQRWLRWLIQRNNMTPALHLPIWLWNVKVMRLSLCFCHHRCYGVYNNCSQSIMITEWGILSPAGVGQLDQRLVPARYVLHSQMCLQLDKITKQKQDTSDKDRCVRHKLQETAIYVHRCVRQKWKKMQCIWQGHMCGVLQHLSVFWINGAQVRKTALPRTPTWHYTREIIPHFMRNVNLFVGVFPHSQSAMQEGFFFYENGVVGLLIPIIHPFYLTHNTTLEQ